MRYHGYIAFAIQQETKPGVTKNVVEKKEYSGELSKLRRATTGSSESINDNISISATISIVADAFLNSNLTSILYVEYMGAKWKVSNIDVDPPRLVLTLGGLYNGRE